MPRRLKTSALDEVFDALANPTRRDLLDLLLDRDRTAGELADEFDMSRPSVSGHLRALREAGLVEERAEGRHRYYRVSAAPMAGLVDWLSPYERFWRGRLSALGDVLDEMDDDNDNDNASQPGSTARRSDISPPDTDPRPGATNHKPSTTSHPEKGSPA
ncbi:metalloregulator ArsR/SmtB family transcription factor [Dietzia sp. NCCP-2495]|uniref:ArsR/SmtB family transcription factor n=1 Tax=Dietzia sp. NCCP-2495 TaxID=2934675 RepID=UPI00285287B8|nr:metalloregulator ArsR/SmtB family transcription factor [Dietzia sp. NCCP-2495]